MKLLKISLVIIVVSTFNIYGAGVAGEVGAAARRTWTAGSLLPAYLRTLRARPIPGVAQVAFPKVYPTWPTSLDVHPGAGLLWRDLIHKMYEFGPAESNSALLKLLRDSRSGMFNKFETTFRPTQLKSNPFYSFSGEVAGEVVRAIREGTIFEQKTLEKITNLWRAQHLAQTGDKPSVTKIKQALQLIVRVAEDELIKGKLSPGVLNSIIMAHQGMRDDAAKRLPDLYKNLGIELSQGPIAERPQTDSLQDDPTALFSKIIVDQASIIPPPVQQGSFSYKGQQPRPDCVEASMHEVINAITFDPVEKIFKPTESLGHLSLSQPIKDFYAKYNQADGSTISTSREEFYNLVSGLSGVEYIVGDNEIKGSVENILKVYNHLLGTSATTFEQFAQQLSSDKMTVSITPVESRRDASTNKTYGLFDIAINDKVYNRRFKMRVSIEPGHSEICERPTIVHENNDRLHNNMQGDPTSAGALVPHKIGKTDPDALKLYVDVLSYNHMANYPDELKRTFESDVNAAYNAGETGLIGDLTDKYLEAVERSTEVIRGLSDDVLSKLPVEQLVRVLPYQSHVDQLKRISSMMALGQQDAVNNLLRQNPLFFERRKRALTNFVKRYDREVELLTPLLSKEFIPNIINDIVNNKSVDLATDIQILSVLDPSTMVEIVRKDPTIFLNNKEEILSIHSMNPLLKEELRTIFIDDLTRQLSDSEYRADIKKMLEDMRGAAYLGLPEVLKDLYTKSIELLPGSLARDLIEKHYKELEYKARQNKK